MATTSDFSAENNKVKILADFVNDLSLLNYENTFSNNIKYIMNCITFHFGYASASFWTMNEDLTLTNPIGFNMDQQQLEDYIEWRHDYDLVFPPRLGLTTVDNKLINLNKLNIYDLDNPYHKFLRSRNLYHSDALFFKVGKTVYTAALFKHFDKKDITNPNIWDCLQAVVPAIANQIKYCCILDDTSRREHALKTAFDNSKMSVIIVDRFPDYHLRYYNPHSYEYACDFITEKISPKNIIDRFARLLIQTCTDILTHTNELSLTLTGNSGKKYNFWILYNQWEKIYTITVEPDMSKNDCKNSFTELFSQLTPTEQKVAALISQGFSNKDIANKMFISLNTVKTHTNHIFSKMGVSNRNALVAKISNVSVPSIYLM